MRIDINKTYRTKAGHDVQIFTTGAPEPYPVVGIIKCPHGWEPMQWSGEGETRFDHKNSLVEVKPKRLVYVNLYNIGDFITGTFTGHPSEASARERAGEPSNSRSNPRLHRRGVKE